MLVLVVVLLRIRLLTRKLDVQFIRVELPEEAVAEIGRRTQMTAMRVVLGKVGGKARVNGRIEVGKIGLNGKERDQPVLGALPADLEVPVMMIGLQEDGVIMVKVPSSREVGNSKSSGTDRQESPPARKEAIPLGSSQILGMVEIESSFFFLRLMCFVCG